MSDLKAYRRKGGDIEAQPLSKVTTINGKEYQIGDYLVFADGELDGAEKAVFENQFEPVRKAIVRKEGAAKPGRKAKAKVDAPAEASATSAS